MKNNNTPWQFIKAAQFFPIYAPEVTMYKHKIRGKDGNNKPTGFSEADKEAIRSGLDKLADQLKNAILGLLIALCVVSCSKDPLPAPPVEETEAAPARPDTVHVVITGD